MAIFTGDASKFSGTLATAYGPHVVQGHVVQKATEGTGDNSVTTVVVLLGDGVWDGIKKAYWNGSEIDPSKYHFHNGYLSNSIATSTQRADGSWTQEVDPWAMGGLTYSGTAYVVVRLEGVGADDSLDALKFICRTSRVNIHNNNGDVVDPATGLVIPTGSNPEDYLIYSTNPAWCIADLWIRKRGLNTKRINWPKLVESAAFCDEEIDWIGGEESGRPPYQNAANMVVGADSSISKIYGVDGVWDSGASTIPGIVSGINGFFEFDCDSGVFCAGLTNNTSPRNKTDFKYGLQFMADSSVRLIVNGVDAATNIASWVTGDRFRVGLEPSPKFYKNGILIDTFGYSIDDPTTYPLHGGVAAFSLGAGILRATIKPLVGGAARTRKRFECGLAFSTSTDIATAIEAMLYVCCHQYYDADGKITLVPPSMSSAPRIPTYSFSMANIVADSFSTYRLAKTDRPTKLTGRFLNADDPYLTEDTVTIDRLALFNDLKRHVDGGEIYLGTITRGQAECVMSYYMRSNSDLDLFAKLKGDGRSYTVTPSDIVTISHDVPEWVNEKFLVIEATDESGIDTANQRSFTLQKFNEAIYSDSDQSPLDANVHITIPSELDGAPAATISSLSQTGGYSANDTYTTTLTGIIRFAEFRFPQRARVYIKKPSDVALPDVAQFVLSPDSDNYGSFDFVAPELGDYVVKVVTEIASNGVINPNVSHPTETFPIGNVVLSIPTPQSFTAKFSVSTIEFNWEPPLSNVERVKWYEVWNNAKTTRVARTKDYRATLQVSNGITTANYWLRATDDMGNVSSWVSLPAAVVIVNLPQLTGFTTKFNGESNQFEFSWDSLSASYNVDRYQISESSSFTTLVGESAGNRINIPAPSNTKRSWTFYIRAADKLGNYGSTPASASTTISQLPKPTVAVDPNFASIPSTATFKITHSLTSDEIQRVTKTVVQVSTAPDFSTIIQTTEYGKIVGSFTVAGTVSTHETIYVRAWFVDFFGAGLTSTDSTYYTFTKLLGSDFFDHTISQLQIALGGVSFGNLASDLGVPRRVSSLPALPDTNYPTNTRIILTTDEKVYRNNSGVWDKSTDGADITVNTVAGNKLIANDVDASRLTVGNFDNLAEDPGFERGGASWVKGAGWSVDTYSPWVHSGTYSLNRIADNSGGVANADAKNNIVCDCKPGDEFYIEGWIKNNAGNGTCGVRISWLNSARIELSTSSFPVPASSDNLYHLSVGVGQAPAGASYARSEFYVTNHTTGAWSVDDIFFRRVTTGAVIADASIGFAKLVDVVAQTVQVGTLTALRAIIPWLAVNEGNFVNASIKSAAIGSEQVDESHIARATITMAVVDALQTSNYAPFISNSNPGDGISLSEDGLFINGPNGAKIRDVPFTVVNARATYSLNDHGIYIGRDTGKANIAKLSYITHSDIERVFGKKRAYYGLLMNFDDYPSDGSCNLDSCDYVRVRAFNQFGDPVLPDYQREFFWKGRGVCAQGYHDRDYADPFLQAVYSVEIHNAFGYSLPVWFSRAGFVPYLNTSFTNGGTIAPVWITRAKCPTNLVATAVSATSVQLAWNPAINTSAGTQSIYYRRFATDDAFTLTASSLSTSTATYLVSNLSSQTEYEFYVSSSTAYASSNLSGARTFSPTQSPPSVLSPSGLTATGISSTQIYLQWMENDSGCGGAIYRSSNGGASFGFVTLTGNDVVTYTDTPGGTAGDHFIYKVHNQRNPGEVNSGFSPTSEASTIAPVTPVSSTPSNCVAQALSRTSMRVSWTNNGGTSPQIQISYDLGSSFSDYSSPGNVSQVTYTGLTEDTTYSFRVREGSGTSYSNTATDTTFPPVDTNPYPRDPPGL